MKINLEKYNQSVRNWGKDTITKLKAEGRIFGIVHRENSLSKTASLGKMSDQFREKNGQIERVSIKFPRVLVFTHKGAGKGRGGVKGSRWIDKYGNKKSTNPNSRGKMGTAGRVAKPFFNKVLDSAEGVEALADIAAAQTGDLIVNNMLIK